MGVIDSYGIELIHPIREGWDWNLILRDLFLYPLPSSTFKLAPLVIILVTHDPRVAASASRIIRMRDGQIADETRLDDGQDSRAVLSSLVDLEV